MPFINDSGLDGAISWIITNGDRLDICSQEPTTYTEATSTYSLGNAAITQTGPANASVGTGRASTVPAINGASVTASGTASHYGITDGTSILAATNALASSQVVTSGNTFNLASFQIIVRDPT